MTLILCSLPNVSKRDRTPGSIRGDQSTMLPRPCQIRHGPDFLFHAILLSTINWQVARIFQELLETVDTTILTAPEQPVIGGASAQAAPRGQKLVSHRRLAPRASDDRSFDRS